MKPGVQKPHCEPWQSTMACCTGCSVPSFAARCSIVTTWVACNEPMKRMQALTLSRSLRLARELARQGERDAAAILGRMQSLFAAHPEIRVDYLALVDGDTLADVATVDRRTVALVAARVGRTRLIDNEPLGEA